MISPAVVIEATTIYLIVLFLVAYFVEIKFGKGKNLADNPVIYTLALAIYCTAWTFYGNVGLATTTGYLFLGVYLGPSLLFLFSWAMIRQMVRIRNEYNVTSIADFISTRYGKSSVVAALVSLIALVGIIPYLSLQLKAIFSSYSFITTGRDVVTGNGWIDLFVLLFIIIFTIIFGLRRLDQSEKHPGMVMIIAIQSIVKIIAFLAVGIFVTYFMHHGFREIFSKMASSPDISATQIAGQPSFSLFFAYITLSFFAIFLLPRQFHMTVVENTDEKHIRTAAWLLPLYFICISIFVIPIAMVGIIEGNDKNLADFFILLLPLHAGKLWLSLLVFIGGFSAAISMIMISAMTITTMTANHLVLPFFEKMKISGSLRKNLLPLRWTIVTLLMIVAYIFEVKIGSSYVLVKIGMISFAAVLQFAPVFIGALFWRKGNRAGAIMGMIAGFLLWIYTSLLPAFIRSGWISESLLTQGPFNIGYLRPENLFGVTGLDPLFLVILFSMVFNVGFYVLGSLIFGQNEEESRVAEKFYGNAGRKFSVGGGFPLQGASIELDKKRRIIRIILGKYLDDSAAEATCKLCIRKADLDGKEKITINELVHLNSIVEKTIASFIGASSAKEILVNNSLFTEEETESLSGAYIKMATDLKLTPKELSEKINYFEERGNLLDKQKEELEMMVRKRTEELEEKNAELEKFNALSVGRELKMAELKDKIRKLEHDTEKGAA
ncbi:MAG: hypothetical protein WC022_00310 [Parcubacteria group bacterium]